MATKKTVPKTHNSSQDKFSNTEVPKILKPCLSAHTVIFRFRQDRALEVLLNLRRKGRQWEFPGGAQEERDGPYPFATALRETEEEVGISADIVKDFAIREISLPSKKYPNHYYLILLVLLPIGITINHKFRNKESCGNQFFSLDSLFLNAFPDNKHEFIYFQRTVFLPRAHEALISYLAFF